MSADPDEQPAAESGELEPSRHTDAERRQLELFAAPQVSSVIDEPAAAQSVAGEQINVAVEPRARPAAVAAQRGIERPSLSRAEPARSEPQDSDEMLSIANSMARVGRRPEADEMILRTAERLTRDLRVQLVALEIALDLGRIEPATAMLQRARLLMTGRVHPHWRSALVDLSMQLTALRRKQGEKSAEAPERGRARQVRQATQVRDMSSIAKPAPAIEAAPMPELALRFRALEIDLGEPRALGPADELDLYRVRLQALEVLRLSAFETLLALAHVHGVDRYDYQQRTVQRVLREFYGRVLLADEVGLGKTVEACLCLKEYVLRGLVRNVLILVPPALRQQWRDELESKFAIAATIVDGDEARERPEVWRTPGVLIASLGLARLEPHANEIARGAFDLVIVDEAHRLKNRSTRSWQLVDRLRSRFLLLLSATPVENDLIEIYNMITLLKPGLFSTEAEFKRAFVGSGGGRTVKDPGRLRSLLRQVMIRNTRALAEAKLPPRFATTLRALPQAQERALYAEVGAAVRAGLVSRTLSRVAASEILRAAGSSPAAAASVLRARLSSTLAERAAALTAPAKDTLLGELFARRDHEKILLFTGHLANLEHLAQLARAAGRRPIVFHGSLSPTDKEGAIAAFAADHDVLVSSESGGEGFNLQFARTLVNYDLPWNPMRIEQRIGRVHRIGQTRDVFIFNLVTAGTLEEEVLRVLDEKINMFELVVGEIDAILGRLGDDELEFQELVLELYAGAGDERQLRERFDELGERMLAARSDYEGVKRFETDVFGRELEV